MRNSHLREGCGTQHSLQFVVKEFVVAEDNNQTGYLGSETVMEDDIDYPALGVGARRVLAGSHAAAVALRNPQVYLGSHTFFFHPH